MIKTVRNGIAFVPWLQIRMQLPIKQGQTQATSPSSQNLPLGYISPCRTASRLPSLVNCQGSTLVLRSSSQGLEQLAPGASTESTSAEIKPSASIFKAR